MQHITRLNTYKVRVSFADEYRNYYVQSCLGPVSFWNNLMLGGFQAPDGNEYSSDDILTASVATAIN